VDAKEGGRVTFFLKTKLYVPPVRPDLVSRPHLIGRLNAGLRRRLTLVSAPAGFGKTTLLLEWMGQRETPVAWLSLDEGDNDPVRFWSYVVAALQSVQAGVGKAALGMLRSPQPPPIESILTTVINESAEGPDPLILVLDDAHTVAAQPIHDGLAFLLNHLPRNMHLVIASRADPPLPLALLRGRDQLIELRTADLRFTSDEAAAFLNEVKGLGLSAEDVAALEARTEGWITGLQLAALALQGTLSMEGRDVARITSFIEGFTGSHRYILDYLVEQVLSHQPQATRSFLLQTSVLDRLTGPLCDAILERGESAHQRASESASRRLAGPPVQDGGSQVVLEQLEEANLFIVPLDDERRWYRYHHLFADVLRSLLERTQPDLVPALHGRASEWYEKSGLIAEAVSHALSAGDVDRVTRLVATNALAMMEHGELTTATFARWVEALPGEVARSRPWLCVSHAWALVYAGQFSAIEPCLQDAERALTRAKRVGSDLPQAEGPALCDAEVQHVAGHIAAIRGYLASLDEDMPQAVKLAREALERLPSEDLMARAWAATLLVSTLRHSGDLVAAARASAEAVAISQASGDRHVAVNVLCNLAGLQIVQGRLHEAAANCRRAIQVADEYVRQVGRPLMVAAYAHAYLSQVLCEWNELDGAMHHARKSLELCQQWGIGEALNLGTISLARALAAEGDLEGALVALQQTKRVDDYVSTWWALSIDATVARVRLMQGDVAAASRWVEESGLSADDELRWPRADAYRTLARILIVQGRARPEPSLIDEALRLLARLLGAAEAMGAMSSVIATLVLQALALQAKGEDDRALRVLERALSLAEPGGYVRTFVDEGAPMGELLRQAAARGIALDAVGGLLAALEDETREERRTTGSRSSSCAGRTSVVEPLTRRELEVLRLLAAGLSNRGIADALVIAVGTVKKHLKNIYRKLGVHSRTQAVARARDQGLL